MQMRVRYGNTPVLHAARAVPRSRFKVVLVNRTRMAIDVAIPRRET